MHCEKMTVTPELADRWFAKRNNRNRVFSKFTAAAYATDMAEGRWKLTHQNAIAFYEDGQLADGQHRLAAIVDSGVSIEFLVFFGLKDDDAYGIDAHKMRQTHDQIRIAGGNDWITKDIVAMARMGIQDKKPSPQQIVAFSNDHKASLSFALDNLPKSYYSAPVRVALAAAFYSEDRAKLRHWCEVAKSGLGVSRDDVPILAFRERLNRDPVLKMGGHGGRAREMLCKLAMRSIQAYCTGEQISRIQEPKEKIYGFPA